MANSDIFYQFLEKMNIILQEDKEDDNVMEIVHYIKAFVSNLNGGTVGIAQINTIAGDVEYNSKKVIKYLSFGSLAGLDAVIFPELTLMGYPIEDAIDRHPIIVEENINWLKEIAKLSGKTAAVIGFVEPRNDDNRTGKKYYNSLAVMFDGKIQGIIRKSLLPNYSEFNDYRYIEPSPVSGNQPASTLGVFNASEVNDCGKINLVNGIRYGISICEDCWNNKNFFSATLYDKDPIDELAKEHPDVFINCSASPGRAKKEQLKHNMLSFISKYYAVPMIYVNQVGATDNSSFDGSSKVFDKEGKLLARAKSYEEQFLIVNPLKNLGKIYPLPDGLEKSLTEEKKFSLDYENDLERTYKTVIQGIRDYFKKNGLKRACIGLSGGLDSSVCAVLSADAIGCENVFGISMPSKITSRQSRSDAELLAENIGINFTEISVVEIIDVINKIFKTLFKNIESKWDCRYNASFTQDNIQARSRALYLWGISNEFSRCIPIATSDKSELYMGYATINGDMSGGFAPVADIPKTKLFALAKWMNSNREKKNAVPQTVIMKKPGAELAIDEKTGKPLIAEDALMPYEFLDEVIWRIENKHECYRDMINSVFLYEKKHPVSIEEKQKWLDKFYKRMSSALYKWSILPPSVIVESRSINKSDYKQPIISSHINYKGTDRKKISQILKASVFMPENMRKN